jgi:hypothetical protein
LLAPALLTLPLLTLPLLTLLALLLTLPLLTLLLALLLTLSLLPSSLLLTLLTLLALLLTLLTLPPACLLTTGLLTTGLLPLAALLTLLPLLTLLLTLLLSLLLALLSRLALLLSVLRLLLTLLPLLALLLTLLLIVLTLLALVVLRLHAAAKRFQVIGKLASAIERVLHAVALARVFAVARSRSALFGCLQILEHLFDIALDRALALAGLVVPPVVYELIILADAVRYAVAADGACGFAELIARLLVVLPHPARRLIYIFFKPRDLIGERLLALAKLLLLLFALPARLALSTALPRKLIDVLRNLFLASERIFGLLAQSLDALAAPLAL